ncbi:MAG: ABC transporter substrate-binding protein [Actinomycetota bacterium]|nr:ABC transporter substrate-binding protein [Actinomycetota bacterium]
MDRLRLMCWCRSCVSGLHLPAYAAADHGVFADHGIEVEFVDCVKTPGGSLGAWSAMVSAVADGEADFALTSVAYLLAGQSAAEGRLAARFAAVFHQRNPIAALVASDSRLRSQDDLAGTRIAATGSWYVEELEGALAQLGLPPLTAVDAPSDVRAALGAGEIDLIPGWVDMSPSYSREGLEIRAIPLEGDAYATGLVAADRLALELVSRMRDALADGYQLQRKHPELGIDALRSRFPGISEHHLRTAWSVFEPYAFARAEPLAMDAERWQRTIDYTAATHGLPSLPAEQIYRQDLVAPATLAPA